ncbi:MAG: hypothetical protein JXB47_07870 [Anaerolineae bacterium]|nr:hypothetical protein [Anaerolineae bacterium]
MAKSWLEKLNVLVSATINEFTEEIGSRLPVPPGRVSPALGQEIEELRKKINEALVYEERLESEIARMSDEIAALDRTDDDAVNAGDDARARRLVQKIRLIQNDISIRQADLDQHRRAAAELIGTVNHFESLVGDLTREAPARAEGKTPPRRATAPAPPPSSRREPAAGGLADAEGRLGGGPAAAKPAEAEAPKGKTVRVRVVPGDHPAGPTAEAAPPPEAETVPAPTPAPEPAAAPKESKRYRIPGTGAVVKPDVPPEPASEAAPPPETEKPKRYRIPDTGAVPPAAPAPAEATAEPQETKPALPEVERLVDALQKARRSVEEAEAKFAETDAIRARVEQEAGAPLPEITGVYEPSPDEIDADIAARRKRLEKKKKDE